LNSTTNKESWSKGRVGERGASSEGVAAGPAECRAINTVIDVSASGVVSCSRGLRREASDEVDLAYNDVNTTNYRYSHQICINMLEIVI
jgi:hypothetical protein